MRTFVIAGATLLLACCANPVTAQTKSFGIYRDHFDLSYTNLSLLRASPAPTTLWAKMIVYNATYQWNDFSVIAAVSTRKLAQPLQIRGVGTIYIDPGSLLFYRPAMNTKYIKSWKDSSDTVHGIYAWTVLPPIPAKLIGVELFTQFIGYQANSPNPLWLASPLYQSRSFPITILPPVT